VDDEGGAWAAAVGPAAVGWAGCAVVLLAGGGSTRMGGVDKLDADLAGAPVLARALAGVPDGVPVVVVGPPRPLARPVLTAREDPPGGGPAAAVAAGLTALDEAGALAGAELVVVLAGDAPWAASAVPALVAALRDAGPAVGAAAAVDASGRRQPLLAVHRASALRARVASEPGGLAGRAAGWLLGGAEVVEVAVAGLATTDVDTPQALDAARRAAAEEA